MVEGGASVIAAFLNLRSPSDEPLVDMHIVTVAPTIIGSAGVQAVQLISEVSLRSSTKLFMSPYAQLPQIPKMDPIAAEIFGKDAVFASRLRAI